MDDLREQTGMTDDSAETWRPVLGFEGFYNVSDRNHVLSLYRAPRRRGQPGLLKLSPDRYGYLCAKLYLAGKLYHRPIHQLVCEAWHGPRPEGLETRHLDGDQLNNAPWNLKWGTPSENSQDRTLHGRDPQANKTHCPAGHPYQGRNLILDEHGWRKCRTCCSERLGRYRDEHREELNARQREYDRQRREGQTPVDWAAEREQRREWEAQDRERRRQEVTAERASRGLPPLVKNAEKTHCPKGHPYDEINTYVVPTTGVRQCRICRKETMDRFTERRKTVAA